MRLFNEDALAVATLWLECRGEPADGKLAVARVIRNRMAHLYASDGTVAGTVLRPWQFSGWGDSSPSRMQAGLLEDQDPIVQACISAWHAAVTQDAGIGDALLYYAPLGRPTPPSWAIPDKFVVQIGGHRFYRG